MVLTPPTLTLQLTGVKTSSATARGLKPVTPCFGTTPIPAGQHPTITHENISLSLSPNPPSVAREAPPDMLQASGPLCPPLSSL